MAEAAPLQLKAITQKRVHKLLRKGELEQLYAVLIRPVAEGKEPPDSATAAVVPGSDHPRIRALLDEFKGSVFGEPKPGERALRCSARVRSTRVWKVVGGSMREGSSGVTTRRAARAAGVQRQLAVDRWSVQPTKDERLSARFPAAPRVTYPCGIDWHTHLYQRHPCVWCALSLRARYARWRLSHPPRSRLALVPRPQLVGRHLRCGQRRRWV